MLSDAWPSKIKVVLQYVMIDLLLCKSFRINLKQTDDKFLSKDFNRWASITDICDSGEPSTCFFHKCMFVVVLLRATWILSSSVAYYVIEED